MRYYYNKTTWVKCVVGVISLSLGCQRIATPNELVLPYSIPDIYVIVFMFYFLYGFVLFQAKIYMRKICIYYSIYLLNSQHMNTSTCNTCHQSDNIMHSIWHHKLWCHNTVHCYIVMHSIVLWLCWCGIIV